jgi:uncharacterized cupin superfamily protein
MTDDPNVFETESWERDLGAARGSRLGPRAGSSELGCALYELDPGGQATPYHMHHGNEELLIVLDGELELRTPEGKRGVAKGAVVGFPAGPAGAHRLRNVSGSRARYLLIIDDAHARGRRAARHRHDPGDNGAGRRMGVSGGRRL